MSETTMSEPLPDGVYCLTESKNRYVMDGETVARFRLALADVKRMHADAKLGAALRLALATLERGGELRVWRSSDDVRYVEGVDAHEGQQDSPTYDALAALLRPSPPEGPQE